MTTRVVNKPRLTESGPGSLYQSIFYTGRSSSCWVIRELLLVHSQKTMPGL